MSAHPDHTFVAESHPVRVIRHALTEALTALDHADWEDLLGQLDVAQSWVVRARAVEDEHDEPDDIAVSNLAEDAGIDTTVCEFCSQPLDDSEPWRRGMDGCGAHERCLKAWL